MTLLANVALLFCVTSELPAAVTVPLTDTVLLVAPVLDTVSVALLLPAATFAFKRTFTVVALNVPLAVMDFELPHVLPLSVDTSNAPESVPPTDTVTFAPKSVPLTVKLFASPAFGAAAVNPVSDVVLTVSVGVVPPPEEYVAVKAVGRH